MVTNMYSECTLKGRVASKAPTELKGRVYKCADDLVDIRNHELKFFVAQDTSISDMPLITMADAVLTEHGGLLSHAAIVCRELGKPCIVAIRCLYDSVDAGDMIALDFSTGTVKVIKEHI